MSFKTERYNYIDVAKGIVIVLMIVGHTDAPEWIIRGIYGFHMPFFFILSGYLYNKEKWEQIGFRKLVKRRFKAYIIPYFFLSFVNLIINIPVEFFGRIRGEELLKSTINHIWGIMYSYGNATATPNCTPLWFLPCIFLCSAFFYWLLKIKSISLKSAVCIAAIFINCLLSYFDVVQLIWHINTALLGMAFMYIGFIIRSKDLIEKIDRPLILFAVLVVIGFYCVFTNPRVDINNNVINNAALLFVGSGSVSAAVLILCRNYLKRSRFLEYLGRTTIIILAFNCAVNTYSTILWHNIPFLSGIAYSWVICTVANIVCFPFIIWIFRKIKARYPNLNLF